MDLESVPPNCHFEVDNIELGLSHFQNQFDVVHARLIAAGLKDFKKCKRDIEMCVKPGGMMIWLDGDYDSEFFLRYRALLTFVFSGGARSSKLSSYRNR